MKYLMIIVILSTSINIAACDNEIQEGKQWQRQYMPLTQVRNNHKSQSITMFILSLLCGPAVMIQPVMHPMDLMKLPTIQAEEIIDGSKLSKKIVTLKSLAQQNEDLKKVLATIAYHSRNMKVESRLLTLQDIGAVEDVHPIPKKLKPHQLKKQDVLKEQFTHCKIAKNPSQK